LISAGLAAFALAAAVWTPHPIGWILERAPLPAVVLLIAVAGSAWGIVLAYVALPAAWFAWSER
jgi:hypothetical protein